MNVQQTERFHSWFARLRDKQAKARIQARIDRSESGNLGDHKFVGGGVSEMRIDYGPGYRVYYTLRDNVMIVLLAGGEKSSQTQDIKIAQALARQL
jgi:putative addiction module killer protein